MADTKKKLIDLTLPVGRLINESLFEKDAYKPEHGREGEPRYKVELAFDDNEAFGAVYDALDQAAFQEWGDSVKLSIDGGTVIVPVLDGNNLARKRETKGKQGDAYKGKLVIRAATKFNLNGVDGPGGIQVFDEQVKPISPANRSAIYNGCFGCAAVSIGTYIDEKTGNPALNFYLEGFQKTGDGERLASAKDTSVMFKPIGRPEGEPVARRRRAG